MSTSTCHAPAEVLGPDVGAGGLQAGGGVVVIGNPNCGKSTLFNALTGGGAHVGNFPGTTVDVLAGRLELGDLGVVTAVDVPGTYSLAARSPEERIAIDAALGLRGRPAPDVLLVVLDAPRLQRSLYLLLQLLELRVPMVVAVNMMDEARRGGRVPDVQALEAALRVPVVSTVARTKEGLDELRERIGQVLVDPTAHTPGAPHGWSDALLRDADELAAHLPDELAVASRAATEEHTRDRSRALALWLLLSVDDDEALLGDDIPRDEIARIRARATEEGRDLEAEIVGQRYVWVDAREDTLITGVEGAAARLADRLDRVLMHPVAGSVVFLAVMALVFQALFSWSDPAIGTIEDAFAWIGGHVATGFDALAAGAPTALAGPVSLLGDLVVQGVIGGVGAVLVFLPQIALLFLLLALLEDSGYLARAAQLMDRVLRAAGLPGQAFVPLLSGFACAVPAIMATRTMPRFRDRLLTMMVVPLTSCSARLPVYTLVIATMLPASIAGWPLPLRPSVLFAMYLFSTAVTLVAATVLGRTLLPERATPAVLELPPYRLPHLPTVARAVWSRVGDFVREAGRVILVATVVLWALLSFPRYEPEDLLAPDVVAEARAEGRDLDALAAPIAIERSYAGRIGKLMEPVIAPLGFDWKIGVGIVGSFAAREVFVSTLGVVYGIGDADEENADLRDALRTTERADGSPAYGPAVGLALMVFFALAMQCTSTLAVLRRETGGWRWPAFIFTYMTAIAWVAAFAVYQGGRWLGLG